MLPCNLNYVHTELFPMHEKPSLAGRDWAPLRACHGKARLLTSAPS